MAKLNRTGWFAGGVFAVGLGAAVTAFADAEAGPRIGGVHSASGGGYAAGEVRRAASATAGFRQEGSGRFGGRGRGGSPDPRNRSSSPGVYNVPTARVGDGVVLGGTVIPYKKVKVSAQVPGEVTYVAGEEGDHFEKGEMMVAVDDSELLARRRQAVAELNNALTALRNARVQYSREVWAPRQQNPNRMPGMGMPALWDQMFTRQFGEMMGYGDPDVERSANLYSAGSKVGQAHSRVEQARSVLEEIDAKLEDTRSQAPFQGVVTDKLVEVGDTVQPGQPLLRFAETKFLRLKVDVPVRLVSGLDKGMRLPVRLDIGNTQTQGKVTQIYPIAEPDKHTVTVKLDLPKDTPGGPGMYGEVMVPDTNAPVKKLPVVPHSAVQWRGSLPSVFVVDRKGKARLRVVRLGEATGRGTVAVLSGVEPGERVLLNPPSNIRSGWQVPGMGANRRYR